MATLDDDLLAGRRILVSGGTSGLGAAVAVAAARNGAAVVVTGRNVEAGEKFAAQLTTQLTTQLATQLAETGATAHFVRCDVADAQQCLAAVDRAVELLGGVDGLVNCAGLTTRGTMLDTTPELFDEHVAINTRGPFFLMQGAITDMTANGTGGSIVNVISISAHGGQPYLAPYVASKAALIGLTRNAAHAHRFDRIRINGLNIGWTATEGEDATQRRFHGAQDGWLEAASARLPMGKLGQPDEIADMVVFLLSERSGVVTGSIIDWDQTVPGSYD